MDIEDAFTQDAIAAAGVDVGDDMEGELRGMIQRVCQVNETEMTRDQENIAVLCFVAGRAYQHDKGFAITMSVATAQRFMNYLSEGGT